jgi:hypothetical protein
MQDKTPLVSVITTQHRQRLAISSRARWTDPRSGPILHWHEVLPSISLLSTYCNSSGAKSDAPDPFASFHSPRFKVRYYDIDYFFPVNPGGRIESVETVILQGLSAIEGMVPTSAAEAANWLLFDKGRLHVADQETLERMPAGSEDILVPKFEVRRNLFR